MSPNRRQRRKANALANKAPSAEEARRRLLVREAHAVAHVIQIARTALADEPNALAKLLAAFGEASS